MHTLKPEGGVLSSRLQKRSLRFKIVSILALLACFANLIKNKIVEFDDLLRTLQFIYREMIHVFLRKCYGRGL